MMLRLVHNLAKENQEMGIEQRVNIMYFYLMVENKLLSIQQILKGINHRSVMKVSRDLFKEFLIWE